jgi:RecA-family ATPase
LSADLPCPTTLAPALPASLHGAGLLLDREIKPPEFIVKPFLPRGELIEIVGAHGAYKSTIALDACLAIATGRPWGGVPTVQGRTVFITLEDSEDTLARRVKAWLDGVQMNADLGRGPSTEAAAEADVRRNFQYLAREIAQALVLTKTADGATTARLDVADHVAQLVAGASLVVLETASRLHDGPETNDAFAAFVRSLETIARSGAAVVIVRHMSKQTAREMKSPQEIDSYAGRGGGALSDAVRSCLVVVRQDGGRHAGVTLTAAKTTHARPGDTIAWKPIVVPSVEAVRLEVQTAESRALEDAEQLLAYMATCEGGVTRKFLHDNPPPGLGRARTKQALAYLEAQKLLVVVEELRGRNKHPTPVYYTPAQAIGMVA